MIVNASRLSLLAVVSCLTGCVQDGAGQADTAQPVVTVARAADCLQLEQGWVRAPMPGHAMTAAYGRLSNRCDVPVALDWLHSDRAAKVELHRTEIVDGISRMRAETQPQVPAGGTLALAPGGLHLMLHGLAAGVVDGAQMTLSLGRAADDVLRVQLPVRGLAGAGHATSQANQPMETHKPAH